MTQFEVVLGLHALLLLNIPPSFLPNWGNIAKKAALSLHYWLVIAVPRFYTLLLEGELPYGP